MDEAFLLSLQNEIIKLEQELAAKKRQFEEARTAYQIIYTIYRNKIHHIVLSNYERYTAI